MKPIKNWVFKNNFGLMGIFSVVLLISSIRFLLEYTLLNYNPTGNVYEYFILSYLEVIFFFVIIFLLVSTLIAVLVKKKLTKVMNVCILFFPLILFPVLFDTYLFGSKEGYVYSTADNLLLKFITATWVAEEISKGISLEISVFLIIIFCYVLFLSKSLIKSFAAVLCSMAFISIWGTPSLFWTDEIKFSSEFIFLFYFVPLALIGIIIFLLFSREKLYALIGNLRITKSLGFIIPVILGAIAASYVLEFANWFEVFLSCMAVFLVWQFAVVINDIADVSIDKVSNRNRPLIKGIISKKEFIFLGAVFAFFSLAAASLVNFFTILFIFVFLVLALAYSLEPIRLRKNFLGNVVIGLSISLCYFFGFFSMENFRFPENSDYMFAGMLFLFGLFITLAKDAKDFKGDLKDNISNLFTLFGVAKAKRIIAVLLLLVFLLPGLLTLDFAMVIFSITLWTFSIIHYLKNSDEKILYMCVMLILVYFFISFHCLQFCGYAPNFMFQESQFSESSLEDIVISKAITFLYYDQLPHGEFPTFMCTDADCSLDSTAYITPQILNSIDQIDDKRITAMKDKASKFLLGDGEDDLWRYYSSFHNTKNIKFSLPPDIDDTSIVSLYLINNGFNVQNNLYQLLLNRNVDGLFLTWIDDPNRFIAVEKSVGENEIDCVVNTNVLLYLSKIAKNITIIDVADRVCSYINSEVSINSCNSPYAPDEIVRDYVFSRAFDGGVTCLNQTKEIVVSRTISKFNKQELTTDKDLALTLVILNNVDYKGPEVNEIKNMLVERQMRDGSWQGGYFYKAGNVNFWSKDWVVALAIEGIYGKNHET